MTWLAIGAALVIVAITAGGVATLDERAEAQVERRLLLTRFEGHVDQEAVIVRYALNAQRLSSATTVELVKARRQTDGLLARLVRPGDDPVFEMRGLLRAYREAGDDIIQALAVGQVEQAFGVDQLRATPALGLVRDATDDANIAADYLSAAASRRAAEISGALVVGALVAIGLLAWRVDRARRAAARLAGEHDTLRGSEERFRALVQNSSDVISVHEPDGTVRYASPAVERMLGYPPVATLGRPVLEAIHQDDAPIARQTLDRVLRDPGVGQAVELRVRHRDGSWRDLEAIVVNLMDEPSVVGVVANARDIGERKRAAEALREAESRYRALVEQVPAVTYLERFQDDRYRMVYVSPQAETILGWAPQDWLDDPDHAFTIVHPDDLERVASEDARAGRTGQPFRVEYRQRTRDGRYIWVHDEAVPIERDGEDRWSWQGVVFDITERRERELRLAHQAFHDPLTGLPNRALFMDRLGDALGDAEAGDRALAVFFLDLDGFKRINDRLGHEVGDQLLVAVGRRIQELLRPGDLLARLGGDEFTILLDDIAHPDVAIATAERILARLLLPFALDDQSVKVAASIGIAVSDGGDSPDEALGAADLALYAAKRKGSGHYAIFHPAMIMDAEGDRRLEADLRRALERDEVQLYYQPVVELATGRLLEVEALLRWSHPERGLLPPTDFLDAAERVGLAVPLGRWVLGAAARQARRWRTDHPARPSVPISVNVSPSHLRDPAFETDVAGALAAADLVPELLKLEIGERDLLAYAGTRVDGLQALKALGVGLVVDNFGKDHGGLGVIQRLPIDAVKIDHALIGSLGRDRDASALVRAVIGFTRSLGRTVAAEGIESADQVRELRELGCDRGQGFYFARPRPGDEIGAILADPTDWEQTLPAVAVGADPVAGAPREQR